MEKYDCLKAYKAKYNSTCVPGTWKEDPQMGNWIYGQRTIYKDGHLSKERVAVLESIGFMWDPNESRWMGRYDCLKAYKAKHNSTWFSTSSKEDSQLCSWDHHQRKSYKRGNLSKERISCLKFIGFIWDITGNG